MSLSLAGVKNDAYIGIEKYVKLHQNRILAEERQRYQAIKVEEDRKALKKTYERKMMIEKGFKIKSVSENDLQCIFEFDSK
jgi:outer membrane protein assembly factor BamA